MTGGILHESPEVWDTTLATHLDATFLLSKYAAASMVKRKRGKIINLASMYSYFGAGLFPSYGAAKGAIVQLTRQWVDVVGRLALHAVNAREVLVAVAVVILGAGLAASRGGRPLRGARRRR